MIISELTMISDSLLLILNPTHSTSACTALWEANLSTCTGRSRGVILLAAFQKPPLHYNCLSSTRGVCIPAKDFLPALWGLQRLYIYVNAEW